MVESSVPKELPMAVRGIESSSRNLLAGSRCVSPGRGEADRETDRERERQTERDRERERQRETDRQRERAMVSMNVGEEQAAKQQTFTAVLGQRFHRLSVTAQHEGLL
jgi:hypothetical protein